MHVRKNGDNINDFIKEMIDFYTEQKSQFNWNVSENCSPSNLKEILLSHGFKHRVTNELLIFNLRKKDLPPIPKLMSFEIKEKLFSDIYQNEEFINFNVLNFPKISKEETIEDFVSSHENLQLKGETNQILLIYDNSGEAKKLISSAGLIIHNETPQIALMTGASTHPDYRNKGIYSFVIIKRLHLMKEQGVEYAYVDADVTTSAHILKRIGFEKAYKYDIFVYNPNNV